MTQPPEESPNSRVELSLEKFRFAREVARSLAAPLKILSFSGPVYFASRIAAHIAGRQTEFNFGVSMVLSLTAVLSLTISGAAAVKFFSQRREIARLRQRNDRLEKKLEECQEDLVSRARRTT